MPDSVTLRHWARKAVTMPPDRTARRVVEMVRERAARDRLRRRDARRPTYEVGRSVARLATPLESLRLGDAGIDDMALAEVCKHFLAHEFDLLGSGWVKVRHGAACQGLAGHRYPPVSEVTVGESGSWLEGRLDPRNLDEGRRIWSLVDREYEPIDWQLDFKSGRRWSEATWYRDIAYGSEPGVDVKVPWELARLQHLPQLALAAARAAASADLGSDALFEPANRYVADIRNQLLDFIATNPPRFGVNWAVTMDVAIRVANILLTRDLLSAAGLPIDQRADAVVRRSVLEHGRHIAENLEWDPDVRGNHYLADLAGLIWVAIHLLDEPEASGWFEMALSELGQELDLQFNDDGTSFEGSTSYHRLSTELVLFTAALLIGHPDARRRLPADIGDRLAAMLGFTDAVTGPDGRVAQIGDNDSGRLFKLAVVPPDRSLDHRHLLDGGLGLLPNLPLDHEPSPGPDRAVVHALATGVALPTPKLPGSTSTRVGDESTLSDIMERVDRLPPDGRAHYVIQAAGPDLRLGLVLRAFPSGGYWVATSDRMQLVIRCGAIGHHGHGGHDHEDQLGFDLWLDGEHLVADPGSYVYTPLPDERNRYRAAANHAGPRPAGPAAVDLDAYPFQLEGAMPGTCLAWSEAGFAGSRTDRHRRVALAVIRWSADRIEIHHGIEGGALHPSRHADDWRVLRAEAPFSPGYGLLMS